MNGNRADDRGGGIGGEADVTVINSTIARNAAVAHVGGGIWSRSDAFIVNSTISDNYAEGVGGGIFAAGIVGLVKSTVIDNVAPVAANIGAGERLDAFGSIIGPAKVDPIGGEAQPTSRNCGTPAARSYGFNFVTDASCGLGAGTDIVNANGPMLGELGDYGGARRDPPPPGGQPGGGPHPGGQLQLPALRGRARGRTASGRARCGSPSARRVRSARRSATPGARLRRRCRGGGEMTHRFRPRLLRLLTVAVLCGCTAAVALGFGEPAGADAGRKAEAAGEDSPWPRTNAVRPNMRVLRQELARLAEQVELMEQSAENYEDWQTCLRYVPVNEQGDRDRQSGYLYDERDGTGAGFMDGIAVDRRRRWGREDYLFIHFSRAAACRNESPQPGGTAEPASVAGAEPVQRSRRRPGLRGQLARLERKEARLFARSQRLETISERFDEWESCVSWVPVTEMGDPDRKFGYLYGTKGAPAGYRAALHIDRSDWDDPDYMFLALVGGDRPGRTCQDEPGEAVD